MRGLLCSSVERFQGIASVAIGGSTLHSWAGIGLGKGPVEKLQWKAQTKLDARSRWLKTDVLVIDESTLSLNR
jgi:ATP-dependent DNA helicase PIF1